MINDDDDEYNDDDDMIYDDTYDDMIFGGLRRCVTSARL